MEVCLCVCVFKVGYNVHTQEREGVIGCREGICSGAGSWKHKELSGQLQGEVVVR